MGRMETAAEQEGSSMSAAQALSTTGNDRIAPGANRGPFDLVADEIELLYAEAKNWADGNGIESDDLEAVKEAVDTLDSALLKAGQEVEAIRKELVKPFDEAKAAIQAQAHPLIGDTKAGKGKVVLAREALNKIRTGINQKLADKRAAEAARIAAEAEEQRQREVEASRIAAQSGSLEDRERADQEAVAAQQAERVAKSATKAASTGLGLRTTYRAEVTDFALAARHFWQPYHDRFEALVLQIAQEQVRAGEHSIPGITVHEEKKAV